MPLDLGGVQFSIKVTAGKSAQRTKSVASAFRDLNRHMKETIRLQDQIDLDVPKGRSGGSSRSSRSSRSSSTTANAAASAAAAAAATRAIIPAVARVTAEEFAATFVEYLRRSFNPNRLTNRRGTVDAPRLSGTASSPRRIGTTAGVNVGPAPQLRLEDRRRGLSIFRRDTDSATDSVRKLDRAVVDAHGGIQALVGAFAALQLGRFVKNATLLAGRVENLDTVLRNTADTANFSGGQVSLFESSIRKLGITTQATRTIMTRFAQNQLELADAAQIARVAQDAGVVAGINSSQAAERMAIAIQRLDTRMLRNLGILVNLRQEYQRYGLETGRVETSLTAAEKQQIVLNAVIREGAALAGNYEAALGDAFKRFTSLDRKVEEATRVFGEQYLPAFGLAVDLTDAFLDSQAKASQSVLTVEATAASMAVTFVGLGSAITLVNGTLIAYNRLALGMTAANAKAAISLAGLRASFFAFLASPVGLFVAGATAAAGAITLLSSSIQAAKAARDKFVRDTEREISEGASVREIIEDIERLEAVENKTGFESTRLLDNMQSIIALAGDAGTELSNLTNDVDAFLAATFKKFPGANIPLEEQLAAVEERGKQAEAQLKLLRDFQERAGSIAEFTTFTDPTTGESREVRTADALERLFGFEVGPKEGLLSRAIEQLEAFEPLVRRRAVSRELNSTRLRRLEQRGVDADNAQQLALRSRNRLRDLLVGQSGDSSLGELDDIRQIRNNLANTFESRLTIEERFQERRTKIQLDYEQRVEDARKQFADDEEEREKQLAELKVSRTRQLQDTVALYKTETDRLKDTLKAFDDIAEISENAISDRKRQNDKLSQSIRLLGEGLSSQTISQLHEFNERTEEASRAAQLYDEDLRELRKSLVEHERSLLSASDANKEVIQRTIDQTKANIEATESLRDLDAQMFALQEQLAEQELFVEETENLKEFVEQTRDAADALEAQRAAVEGLATESIDLGNQGERSLKKLIKSYEEMTKKLEKAPTNELADVLKKQLKDLEEAFDLSQENIELSFEKMIDGLAKNLRDAERAVRDAQQAVFDAMRNLQDFERQLQKGRKGLENQILDNQIEVAQRTGDQRGLEEARREKAFRNFLEPQLQAINSAASQEDIKNLIDSLQLRKSGSPLAKRALQELQQAGKERLAEVQQERARLNQQIRDAVDRRREAEEARRIAQQNLDMARSQFQEFQKTNSLLQQILQAIREGNQQGGRGAQPEAPAQTPQHPNQQLQPAGQSFNEQLLKSGVTLNNQPSSFPDGFDASSLVTPAKKAARAQESYGEAVTGGLREVAAVLESQTQTLQKHEAEIRDIVGSIEATHSKVKNEMPKMRGYA